MENFTSYRSWRKKSRKNNKKEDGGHNEFDKIKDKDGSRAGNERGYRNFFFLPFSSFSFLQTVPVAFERVSKFHTLLWKK